MKRIAFALACAAGVAAEASLYVGKGEYLDLIEAAVKAYTPERMDAFRGQVREKGITEHGFARLTANLGILVSRGRMRGEKGRFRDMMSVCCAQMSADYRRNGFGVGNDFAVKEIVYALLEAEKSGIFGAEEIARWKAGIAAMEAEKTYSCRPEPGLDLARNWAVFGAASEQARIMAGLGGDAAYVERHLTDQMRFFDANGMYKDPHQPMVYDFVTRLQYAAAMHAGYAGASRAELERTMAKAAGPTLAMQSACGEIPYGGRSNQFLHNETFFAALCEHYARTFMAKGDAKTAARFRRAARRAVDSLGYWLGRESVRHVKNRHPAGSRYGCEDYAYFDKYMVTMGSWAYLALTFADESVPEIADGGEDFAPVSFATTVDFHMHFLSAGGYSVQFDAPADGRYDGSGVGRVHRRGAPPQLVLSAPFAKRPNYRTDAENASELAIMPGAEVGGEWKFAGGGDYRPWRSGTDAAGAFAEWRVACGTGLGWSCRVSGDGVEFALKGSEGEGVAMAVPALADDGAVRAEACAEGGVLTVRYEGWECRHEGAGMWVDTGLDYANRNGKYRRWELRGKGSVALKTTVLRAERRGVR